MISAFRQLKFVMLGAVLLLDCTIRAKSEGVACSMEQMELDLRSVIKPCTDLSCLHTSTLASGQPAAACAQFCAASSSAAAAPRNLCLRPRFAICTKPQAATSSAPPWRMRAAHNRKDAVVPACTA